MQWRRRGGIFNALGTVHVDYTTFLYDSDGALANHGVLTLSHSSVQECWSASRGDIENLGTMAVTDSTFWNYGSLALYNAGTLTIGNCTVFAALSVGSVGISVADATGDTTVYNSIVDSVSGALDQHLAPGEAPSSNDLIVGTQSGGLLNRANGNLVNVNPLLSPIGPYGGPTEEMVPLTGSPAIDAGSNALATDLTATVPTPLLVDQGGFARVYNGTIDIGAVEVQPHLVNTTVAGAGGPGQFTFDDAFALSGRGLGGGTVRFDPTVFTRGVLHTVHILGGLNESFARPVTIAVQGPGEDTVALSIPDQGFDVDPGATLSLSGIAITGARMETALLNQGTLDLTDCAVYDNKIPLPGASAVIINTPMSTLNLTDCSLFGNSGNEGGVLYDQGAVSVLRCTFVGNSAPQGGAIYSDRGGAITIADSTFSGNLATVGLGSAIRSQASALTISNSTFTTNSGQYVIQGPGGITLNNTILAGNTMRDGVTAADLGGNATGSNNLIGTGGSGGLMNGVDGNIVGFADPKLAPLGDYGGPTQTMPPLPGSPAIDAGSNALAIGPDGKPLPTDQRGYYRIFNHTVDIGAVEYGSLPLLPGDANADGKVGFADLVLVARNYGMTDAAWADGDFNADGSVGFDDLVIVARNYGKSVSLTSAAAINASSVTPTLDVQAADEIPGLPRATRHRRM